MPESKLDSDICAHVHEQFCCKYRVEASVAYCDHFFCLAVWNMELDYLLDLSLDGQRTKIKWKIFRKRQKFIMTFCLLTLMRTQNPHRRCKVVYTLYRCIGTCELAYG